MVVTYRVLLKGVKPGVDANSVRGDLARLFNPTPEQGEALLSPAGRVVKTGLTMSDAARYHAALEAAGATCVVEPEEVEEPYLPLDLPFDVTDQRPVVQAVSARPVQVAARPIAILVNTEAEPGAQPKRSKIVMFGSGILVLAVTVAVTVGLAIFFGLLPGGKPPGTTPAIVGQATPQAPGVTALAPSEIAVPQSSGEPASPQTQLVYGYEPAVVTLHGTLLAAPGETPSGEKSTFPALQLEAPIAVKGASPNEPTEEGISLLHMALDDRSMATFQNFKGQRATVTGTLFHSDNGNHQTKVLITPASIAATP